MGLDEAFQGVAGTGHPVERNGCAAEIPGRAPPLQPVDARNRQLMRREQPVHVCDRTPADDGEGTSRYRGQALEQRVQTLAAPDCIRAWSDLDQGAVEVEENGRLRRPGGLKCACHARTIHRCWAARQSTASLDHRKGEWKCRFLHRT